MAEPLLVGTEGALESKGGVEVDHVEVVHALAGLCAAWGKPDKAAEWRAKLPKPAAPAPVK